MGNLDTLLEIQAHDLALDRLTHRRKHLPERARMAQLSSELAGIDAEAAAAQTSRDELATRQARYESDAASLGRRVRELDRTLYGGTVKGARDLAAIAAEVESLRRQLASLEERLLEAMEQGEAMDASLAEMAARRQRLVVEQASLAAGLVAEECVIDADAAAERGARSGLVGCLPASLVKRYEALRARLGGVGAARLVNGSCDGCHLSLPAAERDRLRRLGPDQPATCEQCGRILVAG